MHNSSQAQMGLDPVFRHIDDILVVGVDMVVYVLSLCKVVYFDCHFHAYVPHISHCFLIFWIMFFMVTNLLMASRTQH